MFAFAPTYNFLADNNPRTEDQIFFNEGEAAPQSAKTTMVLNGTQEDKGTARKI